MARTKSLTLLEDDITWLKSQVKEPILFPYGVVHDLIEKEKTCINGVTLPINAPPCNWDECKNSATPEQINQFLKDNLGQIGKTELADYLLSANQVIYEVPADIMALLKTKVKDIDHPILKDASKSASDKWQVLIDYALRDLLKRAEAISIPR